MFIALSTLVILIVTVGLIYRHKRKIHIPLMSIAFAMDLGLVLIIELQRQAIENVIVNHNSFVWFHVSISVLVLVLYIVLAVTGSKMNKLPHGSLLSASLLTKIHKISAMLFIVFRLTNYVTSMFMPVQMHL